MIRACSTNGKKRSTFKLLVRKPERNRPLGRPRHGWVNNIKLELGEIRWGGTDWIGLAQDRESGVAAQLVVSRAVLSSIELLCCMVTERI
jgi:hypothetical protein